MARALDPGEQLHRIRDILAYFERVERQAREALKEEAKGEWFVALCGVQLPNGKADVCCWGYANIHLSRVEHPPGIVHICRAAQHTDSDYLAVARFAPLISGEASIVPSKEVDEEEAGILRKHAIGLLWHFVALLKLRGHSSLFCPAAASRSWNVIPAITDGTVRFMLLDDQPKNVLEPARQGLVTDEDLAWVQDWFWEAMRLRGLDVSRRFGLAFNIAYTWNHSKDMRACLGSLWTGLEALFGDRGDMKRTKGDQRGYSDKLADRIAEWVRERNGDKVRGLYEMRCDALHGRWVGDEAITEATRETQDLLRRCLMSSIEREAVPLPDWGER